MIVLFGIGQIRVRPLTLWTIQAADAIAGPGYHNATRCRVTDYPGMALMFWPWARMGLVLSASLFIAHKVVVDSVIERRRAITGFADGILTGYHYLGVGTCWNVRTLFTHFLCRG